MMYDVSIDCCFIYFNGAEFDFFLITNKKQFKSACPHNQLALVSWSHPFIQMDEDAKASMGMAINLLWCRTAFIPLKIINIAQATLMEVSRRDKAKSPMSFAGVLQRVMAKGPAAA